MVASEVEPAGAASGVVAAAAAESAATLAGREKTPGARW